MGQKCTACCEKEDAIAGPLLDPEVEQDQTLFVAALLTTIAIFVILIIS